MTMTLIETIEVGSGGAASIEFTGIDTSSGDDLLLTISVRSDRAASDDIIGVRVNGVIASNRYYVRSLYGNSSSALSAGLSSDYALWGHYMPAQSATASTFGTMKFYFPNFASNSNKSVSIDSVGENNSTASAKFIGAGIVNNTAPISSLMVWSFNGANLSQYTTASLYKITKA